MRTTELEILYGRQPVREVLRASRRQVFRVIAAGENRPCREVHEILRAAESRGIRVQVVQAREVGSLAGNGHHQGIVAEVGPYPYAQWDSLPPPRDVAGPLYLLLDHVQDPQNLGSLLRSAEAAGVDAVILPAWRAAGVTPAVVRA
jgi:23S rRNA (guanosine2251-2'-O)-methyltransferase